MGCCDELAAIRAENERLRLEVESNGNIHAELSDKFGRRVRELSATLAEVDQLRAENERLKQHNAMLDQITLQISEHSTSLARQLGDVLVENERLQRQLTAKLDTIVGQPASPSGPSWLERVAAGPMRIGRPLP